MIVAIVGSRTRDCRDEVEAYVAGLPDGTVVISGGAKGVDSWAAAAARRRGLEVVEYLPEPATSKPDAVTKLMQRNQRIAIACERLVAWPGNTGGTWATVRMAHALGRPIEIR